LVVMPRDGAIIFRDLVGKLGVLNVECDKCGRRGRPRKMARNEHDPCGARCPELSKVV
jgi:hypothetical protein